jgi:hypothetical protein
VQWTTEPPVESGIYLFMDDLDTLHEELSTLEVDCDRGHVVPAYNQGSAPVALSELRGSWFGPIAHPPSTEPDE